MMSRWRMTVLPAALCMLATRASAGALAAWWTDLGPSLLVQDDETASIRYSLCTSENTPILPEDKTITAPLYKYPPKNGTAIAGTGWWDTSITWASIFYQDKNDNIINSYLKCDPNTGYWLSQGDWIVSAQTPSVSSGTGLAAVLIGSSGGYRVFYHDDSMTLRMLAYTSDTSWEDKGVISQDAGLGSAIGAVFSAKNNNNITVAAAYKDGENIETSRWFSDESWHVSTFPRPLSSSQGTGDVDDNNTTSTTITNATDASSITLNATAPVNFTLPAWDGRPASLGMSIDKAYTRSIFYIGTDGALHQLANVGYAWRAYASQNTNVWPAPDNGQLAVVSDFATSSLRVYYQSGGQIVELNGDDDAWTAAAVLPNDNSTATSSATPSSGSNTGASSNSSASAGASNGGSDNGLSSGAKIGVGVGVSLGVVAIGGMLAALLFLRRRQRRHDADAANASTVGGASTVVGGSSAAYSGSTGYSPGGFSDYYQQHAGYQQYGGHGQSAYGQAGWAPYHLTEKPSPGELDNGRPAAHEVHGDHFHHEMMGEGHYREAP